MYNVMDWLQNNYPYSTHKEEKTYLYDILKDMLPYVCPDMGVRRMSISFVEQNSNQQCFHVFITMNNCSINSRFQFVFLNFDTDGHKSTHS